MLTTSQFRQLVLWMKIARVEENTRTIYAEFLVMTVACAVYGYYCKSFSVCFANYAPGRCESKYEWCNPPTYQFGYKYKIQHILCPFKLGKLYPFSLLTHFKISAWNPNKRIPRDNHRDWPHLDSSKHLAALRPGVTISRSVQFTKSIQGLWPSPPSDTHLNHRGNKNVSFVSRGGAPVCFDNNRRWWSVIDARGHFHQLAQFRVYVHTTYVSGNCRVEREIDPNIRERMRWMPLRLKS
jgi:hypothetical protein